MKISHIEHLGIAVKSIEEAHRFPEMRRHQNRIVGTDQSGQYHRQFH